MSIAGGRSPGLISGGREGVSHHVTYPMMHAVADLGFSPGGAPTPKIAIIFHIFAENCMKMKEFGPPGGGRPWRPPWIRQSHVMYLTLTLQERMTDRRLRKYYLPTTSFAGGNKWIFAMSANPEMRNVAWPDVRTHRMVLVCTDLMCACTGWFWFVLTWCAHAQDGSGLYWPDVRTHRMVLVCTDLMCARTGWFWFVPRIHRCRPLVVYHTPTSSRQPTYTCNKHNMPLLAIIGKQVWMGCECESLNGLS